MSQHNIWLDCDPGHDDMFAIIMAALSPTTRLIGISTSSGNSTIENTTQNALDILFQIGKADIQVVKGLSRPLCRKLTTAPEIHGELGLEGATLLRSPKRAIQSSPFQHIYQQIMGQPEKIDFVVTGALTNTAILLQAFPDIAQKLNGITIMGGAIGRGNVTPAAEFNFYVDPEAAAIVLASGIKLAIVPLQVTHTAIVSEEIFAQLAKLNSNFGQKLTPLLREFQKKYKECENFDFPVVHDPCTIYYLIHPQDFYARNVLIDVELEGCSRGRTNCNFLTGRPNATICERMNVAGFWQEMMNCLKSIK